MGMTPTDGNAFLDQLMAAFRSGTAGTASAAEEGLVARVQALYACILQGDFQALGALMTEDVTLDIDAPSMPSIHGTQSGRARVLATIERNFSQVSDQAPEIREVAVQGDTVLILSREAGRTQPDGQPYYLSWLQFFTFREGLLCLFRERLS